MAAGAPAYPVYGMIRAPETFYAERPPNGRRLAPWDGRPDYPSDPEEKSHERW
jgi:hypothetical protein